MLVAQDVIYVPSNRHHVADTNIHQISVTIAWKIAIVVTTQYLVKVFVVHKVNLVARVVRLDYILVKQYVIVILKRVLVVVEFVV
jgi:hypothetical protein